MAKMHKVKEVQMGGFVIPDGYILDAYGDVITELRADFYDVSFGTLPPCTPSRGNELTGYNVTEEFEQLQEVESVQQKISN